MSKPFIVYALPRSRTVWLSKFLTYGAWRCFHDIVIDLHSIDNIKECLSQPYIGTVETAMVDGWQAIKKALPDAKIVVINRSVGEVNRSFSEFGIHILDQLFRREKKLQEVAALPDTLVVSYEDLDKEATCKKIFEFCLEQPFDRKWWMAVKGANIQVDMAKRMRKIQSNRQGIDKLKQEASC